MKKTTEITLIGLSALIWVCCIVVLAIPCDSCGCKTPVEAIPEKALVTSQEYLKVQGGYDDAGRMRTYKLFVRKWMYEGHEYLEISSSRSGWIHDPNCRACQDNKTESTGLSEYERIFGGGF